MRFSFPTLIFLDRCRFFLNFIFLVGSVSFFFLDRYHFFLNLTCFLERERVFFLICLNLTFCLDRKRVFFSFAWSLHFFLVESVFYFFFSLNLSLMNSNLRSQSSVMRCTLSFQEIYLWRIGGEECLEVVGTCWQYDLHLNKLKSFILYLIRSNHY